MSYAELHAVSAFSFQRGASLPQELMERAAALGYRALALTDECSMAGVVRAWQKGKELRALGEYAPELIIGSELQLDDGLRCVALAQTQHGYSALCGLITAARRRSAKGHYQLRRRDFDAPLDDVCLLWMPRGVQELDELAWLRERYHGRLWIAAELHRDGRDAEKLSWLQTLAQRLDVPVVASGDVHMHIRQRRALQDVMTALRLHQPVSRCGRALFANGERHLRTLSELRALYPQALLDETLRIAERCTFRIDEVRYQYPREIVEPGKKPSDYLRELVEQHLPLRWPQGCLVKVRASLEKELRLIADKQYEAFFLTVYDIVRYARSQNILCQGRGSAANSVVCYVLGITEVNPEFNELLFERFVSRERDEPPDIDVDFEHERREEVIQYIYKKYGRERAALAATVISYRPRSALRDVGRALDIGAEVIDRVAQSLAWWDDEDRLAERLLAVGVDPQAPRTRRWLQLSRMLMQGFPRHLSQHVGGFVISDQPLHELVPVENAAMPNRSIIQWDKDDLEALNLLKVDVLALGMLSALRRTLQHLRDFDGGAHRREDIPDKDLATYAMLQRAETIGVFQIESRAQMSMLPRLRPENLYDITVQVAIVRPGPIQGGMVHPYLRRRMGKEKITYPLGENDPLKNVLERTSGVPIFQEQVMQIAMVAADFSADQADALRRAMAAWKRAGGIDKFRDKLMTGMQNNGYSAEFAAQIFRQIEGFGSYGFPESHAASFALLAYQSAYLKCHQPAAFICGLINSQPMGFYPPTMLVREAQRARVEVRKLDVQHSCWDCRLEHAKNGQPALRLGLRLVKGFNSAAAQRLEKARLEARFCNIDDLARRAALSTRELNALAAADALQELVGHRFAARWQTRGHVALDGLLQSAELPDEAVVLQPPLEGEDILADYQSTGLSLRRHPVALLRTRLNKLQICRNAGLAAIADGQAVRVAGIVMFRQRPGSAKGTMFITLEDETGIVNLIVRPELIEREREAVVGAQFLLVRGMLQRQHTVTHVIAAQFIDRSSWIAGLPYLSRDFH